MDFGVYDVKPLKVNTLQPLPKWTRLEEGAFCSRGCIPFGSLIIVDGMMNQCKYASVLADHAHPYMRIVFQQNDGLYQQDNTDLNPI
ncbi:hypothetical protein TNCV_2028931 [Trichonephila clavipes]|nr:hypothetical protein TNCV_2028931 [Trichonephila clavipes]